MSGVGGVQADGFEADAAGTVPPPAAEDVSPVAEAPADGTGDAGFTLPAQAPAPEETAIDEARTGLSDAASDLDALPERISDGKGRFTPETNAALDGAQAALKTAREADPGLDGPLSDDAAALETRIETVRTRGRDQVRDDLHLADPIGEVDTNIVGKVAVHATDHFVEFANGAAGVAVRSARDLGDLGAKGFTAFFGEPGRIDESLLARGADGVENGVRSLLTRPGDTVIAWRDGAVDTGRDLRDGARRLGAGLGALASDPGATAEAVGTAFGDHAKQAYREHGAAGAAGALLTEAGLLAVDAKDVLDVARGLRTIARASDEALALADDLDALGRSGRPRDGDLAALERVEGHLDDPGIAGLLDEAKRAGEAAPRRPIAGVVAVLDEGAPLSLNVGDGLRLDLSPRTFGDILAPGTPVEVRRTSGAVETWQVYQVTGDTVVVSSDAGGQTLTKSYNGDTLDRLLDVNPDLRERIVPSARAEAVANALGVGDTATIGRRPDADISVPGQRTVSREHASITRLPDTADGRAVHLIGDANSTNGTLVRTADGTIEIPRGGTVMVEGPVSLVVGRVGAPGGEGLYDPGLVIALGDAPAPGVPGVPGAPLDISPNAPPGAPRQVYDPNDLRIAPSDLARSEASFANLEALKGDLYAARGTDAYVRTEIPTENGIARIYAPSGTAEWYDYVPRSFDPSQMTGFKARLSVAPQDTAKAWDIVLDVAEEHGLRFKMATPETLGGQVGLRNGVPSTQDGKTFTLYHAAPRTGGAEESLRASSERWAEALQEISDRFEANGIEPHRFADPNLDAPLHDVPIEGGFPGVSYTFDKSVGGSWTDVFGPGGYVSASERGPNFIPPGGPFEDMRLR